MEHREIPENQLHEVKGASTASSGDVLKSKGDGTTEFAAVKFSEVSDIGIMTNQPDVEGDTVPVAEFNALLEKLKSSGFMRS